MNATKRILLAILAMSSSTTATPLAVKEEGISRIIGGDPSNPGEFPYFADFGGCGGSLIAPDIVLTAAHCVIPGIVKVNGEVIIGGYERGSLSEGAQKRFCTAVIGDPNYDDFTFNYDFALCKLNEPVIVDTSFVTLELNEDDSVPSDGDDNDPSDGDDLITMGHGVTDTDDFPVSDILLKLTVPYVNSSICAEYLSFPITDKMLCAGFESEDKGACFGDSGGPIVMRIDKGDGSFVDIHVGVTSFAVVCGVAKFPIVYARTSARLSWIKSTMCTELNSVASFCAPSVSPTQVPPSNSPTEVFSNSPTEVFSNSPTKAFSNSPTEAFSNSPTEVFSNSPTEVSSNSPTEAFSNSPTEAFSNSPTEVFSNSPTEVSSNSPTEVSSNSPTEVPRKKSKTKKTKKTKETKKPKTKKTKNA